MNYRIQRLVDFVVYATLGSIVAIVFYFASQWGAIRVKPDGPNVKKHASGPDELEVIRRMNAKGLVSPEGVAEPAER
jgi:hypothetical protein